jgi:hypothetical protein
MFDCFNVIIHYSTTLKRILYDLFVVVVVVVVVFFFSCGSTAQFWTLAASMKLSVSFRLLDVGQSAGLFGRVISSSQGIC